MRVCDRLRYRQSESTAICTYSGVFNTAPEIHDAQLIICDDAHAAEPFVAGHWSVRISRSEHGSAFAAITRLIEPVTPRSVRHHIKQGAQYGPGAIDLVSAVLLAEHYAEPLPVQDWINEISSLVAEWGANDHKFERELNRLETGIRSGRANAFEPALERLGRCLGARVHRWKEQEQAAPDVLWMFGTSHAIVFEAKTDSKATHLPVSDVRQALTHEQRTRDDQLIPAWTKISTVIVSPHNSVEAEARKLAGDLCHLSHDDIVKMSEAAIQCLRVTRRKTREVTDEQLLSYTENLYRESGLFIDGVLELATTHRVDSL
ncbi:MAG: hypothetical protein AAF735_03000 [Myxococcota bacterium]